MKGRCFLLFFSLLSVACTNDPVALQVIATSDLHGELGSAMSSLYTYIEDAKATIGENLILLDCGDNLQGSPEVYYSEYVDTTNLPILSKVFESLEYDALSVGNHDIEVGPKVYNAFYSNVSSPVLCANVINTKSGKTIFQPYTILRKRGLKIAVIGMCNPTSIEWIPDAFSGSIEILPLVECSEHWVKHIRRKERPDVIIGLYHTGGSRNDEDSAYEVAEKVPGFSLFCCGHIHRCDIDTVVNSRGDSVMLVSSDAHASHLSRSYITVSPSFLRRPKVSVRTTIEDLEGVGESIKYKNLVADFIARADRYYSLPIATIKRPIFSNDAIYGPCEWTGMLHNAYRKMSEVIGFTEERSVNATIVSPSIRDAVLEAGPLTLKDIISIYPYNNTLSVIEMTGQEIKNYLEYSFSLLLDYHDKPIYVFDTVSGFRYTVDKEKPYGSRITMLGESNGNRFYQNSIYRVAMNTFRASGGHGHLTKGLGWSEGKMKARTIAISSQNIVNMLLDQFTIGSIQIATLNEWSFK